MLKQPPTSHNITYHHKKSLPSILTKMESHPQIRQKKTSLSFAAQRSTPHKYRSGSLHNERQSGFQIRNKEREKQRMERSMMKYLEKENYYIRTLLQKKKKKKHYTSENCKKQEMDFFNSLGSPHISRREINDEADAKKYRLKNLPSLCFDSLFAHNREGSCFTVANNKLYLFGGTFRRKTYFYDSDNSDIMFHNYENGRWKKQIVEGQFSPDKRNLIHHTINTVSKKLILIVGGMIGDTQKTLSKFNESILLYNTETHRFQEMSWNTCLRCHASTSFDNYVLLYGGIDEDGKVKSDFYVVCVAGNNQNATVRVNRFQVNEELVHHQMATTLGEDKGFMRNLRQNNGIYVFGGQDQHGSMSNQLKFMRMYSVSELDKKVSKTFTRIQTYGQGPCGRKNHTMSLLPKKNSLVIIGGLDQHVNLLSDIWMIQLFHLSWHRIETDVSLNLKLGGLCKHAAVSWNNSVYIMGGRWEKDHDCTNLWQLDLTLQILPKKIKSGKGFLTNKTGSNWEGDCDAIQYFF